MSTMAYPPFMSARLSDLLANHIHALAAVELFKNFATPAKAGAHGRTGSWPSPRNCVRGLKARGRTSGGASHWIIRMHPGA